MANGREKKRKKRRVRKKPGRTAALKKVNIIPIVKGQLFWNRTWDYYSKTPYSPEKTPLPNCKVDARFRDAAGIGKIRTGETDENGYFEIRNIPDKKVSFWVTLSDKDDKIVELEGYRGRKIPGFWIKKGRTIQGKLRLNEKDLKSNPQKLQVEIKNQRFRMLCDFYKNIVEAHQKWKNLTGETLPRVKALYPKQKYVLDQNNKPKLDENGDCIPSPATHTNGTISFPHNRITSLSVILHEYGHFIISVGEAFPDKWRGYDYKCAHPTPEVHHQRSKEFREVAWNEAVSTFFGSAIADDPRYYNRFFDDLADIENDRVTGGDHVEGSIEGALWSIYKIFESDFKDILKCIMGGYDPMAGKLVPSHTVWDFYDNCKRLGKIDLLNVKASFINHGMIYRYDFLSGANMYKCVSGPYDCPVCHATILKFTPNGVEELPPVPDENCSECKGKKKITFSKKWKIFMTVDDLHKHFGGGGPIAEYKEEFFNSNNEFHRSKPWKPGSNYLDPKPLPERKFIVPVRKRAW